MRIERIATRGMGVFQLTCSILLLLLHAFLPVARCQQYSPVCDPDGFLAVSAADVVPSLPDQFSIVVEANFIDDGSTRTVTEYFDAVGNRGRFDFTGRNHTGTGIFDYDTQEIYLYPFIFGPDECVVRPITASSRLANFAFGFTMVDGKVHIGSPRTVFEGLVNESVSQYVGPAVVRGIDCDQWTTCVNTENSSFIINYFFSSNWSYNGIDAETQVPIQFELMASRMEDDGTARNFTHVYSFTDFRSGPAAVPDAVFTVPFGMPCKGRSPGMAVPTLPNHFSFSTLSTDPRMQTVQSSREYYDLEQRLFRLDTYYDGRLGGPPGPISIIHDFNLETQYIINHRFANCSISPLTAESPFVFFDVSIADSPDRPSLATPNQILFLSNEFNYSYEGVTTVRGVEVDSWLSVREFERLGFGLNFTDAVLEFYFTRPGWKIASQIDVSETPIPWGASFRGVISYYNTSSNMTESLNITGENDILGFTTEEPLFDIYDTSICIEPTEYVILTMFFAGHETGMDFGQLRRAIRSAIVDYTGITPLQVGNIQVIGENGTHIYVSAHVSNLTAVASSERDVITASTAINMILRETQANNSLPFQFQLGPGSVVQPYFLDVAPGEGESQESGYPAYAIAAIVIMFFIGILLGIAGALLVVLVACCVWRRRKREAITVGSAKYEKQMDDVIVT